MKTIATLLVGAAALTAPFLSFAQSTDHSVSNAQVRADLVQLEQAGYTPFTAADPRYSEEIQIADAQAGASDDTTTPSTPTGAAKADDAVGGMLQNGKSDSGKPISGSKPSKPCVGPVSYCNIFFGS